MVEKVERKHLAGLREKMAARDERHKGKNRAPTGKRFAVPASAKPKRAGREAHKARMEARAARRREAGPTGIESHLASGASARIVNRRTRKPHEHKREIARRLRQRAAKKG